MIENIKNIEKSTHFTPYQHYRVTLRFIKDTIRDTVDDICKNRNSHKKYDTRGNVVYRMFGEFNKNDYEDLLRRGQEGIKEIRKENNNIYD